MFQGDEECRTEMEDRSENVQLRCDKLPGQLLTVGELWHPQILTGLSNRFTGFARLTVHVEEAIASPPPFLPASE
ncbi:unnamed protein product [Ilex paraguariensis]|uniref:Uncharacterized protein n=1 Tax=Ilex paraguariensis TaxID=185542 RepID=A0ABC8RDH9_9AQUA